MSSRLETTCLCTKASTCGRPRGSDLSAPWGPFLPPFLVSFQRQINLPSSVLPRPSLGVIYFLLPTVYELWHAATFLSPGGPGGSESWLHDEPLLVPATGCSFHIGSPNLRGWTEGSSISPAFLRQHGHTQDSQMPRGYQGPSLMQAFLV